MELSELSRLLGEFAARREWQQFHTPKNLSMALAGEVGELLAEFQWLTPEQSAQVMTDPKRAPRVRDELADVFAYLLQLADALQVDLGAALREKVARNEERYPESLAKGRAAKYDELEPQR